MAPFREVRWSQWQLKAYETASVEAPLERQRGKPPLSAKSEARMAVLDEVTRAFAPWIQRLHSGCVKILLMM